MKTPTTFTRTLLQTADAELDRIIGQLFPEQRAKAIYYQTFSFACLALIWGFVGLFGEVVNTWDLLAVSLSSGLFAAAAYLSVMCLTGGQGNTAPITNYVNYQQFCERAFETEWEANSDLLLCYDKAISQAKAVLVKRGQQLRLINRLVLFGVLAFCLSLTMMVL